ncbi:MAG: polysaccharide deacetylase family protein [Bacteroidota bacterium]
MLNLTLLSLLFVSNPLLSTAAQPLPETTTPEIAISLDDAPMPSTSLFASIERTQTIIAKLRAVNSPSIGIFALGQNAQKVPQGMEQLKLYGEAGHMIANHSYSHYQLGKVSAPVFIQDIQRAHPLLGSLPNFKPFFRFPYLCEGKNAQQRGAVLQALTTMGYQEGYVTVNNYDFAINHLVNKAVKNKQVVDFEKLKQVYLTILWDCIKFYDQLALQVLGRPVKHVLLLHANDLAAYYIGDVITLIRSKGWRVIPIEEAYQDPIAKLHLTTTKSQYGRIGAIAQEKGFNHLTLFHPSMSYAYIQQALEEAQVFTVPGATP